MGTFLLDKSVTADLGTMKDRGAVRRAVERFYRDLDMVIDGNSAYGGGIRLCGVCGDPGGNDCVVSISGEIQRLVSERRGTDQPLGWRSEQGVSVGDGI